jgi:Avidin family
MKNIWAFCSFLFFIAQVIPTKGQSPTCLHPVGTWKGKDNSQINILWVDSATGEIKGTYRPAITDAAQSAPLSGWISVASGADDQHPSAFTWSSGAVPAGYMVSWTGYCRQEQGIATIRALSESVQVQPDSGVDHLITEMTVWVASAAAGQAHQMAMTKAVRPAPATGIGSASCPYEGKAKNGNPPAAKLVAINLLKNRTNEPAGSDLNPAVTLSGMLNSKDDPNIFDEQQGATISGVLFDVRAEKGESCNCYSTDPNDWDYHIYIGNANAKTIFDCAVVEMTPYSRSIHPEWTLSYVKSLKGKQVQVTGWLLFDFEHTGQSYETNPNTAARNRHTVWEIHPVTTLSAIDQ